MNVFILSTGRCGSTTFAEACKFIKNYTSSHESRAGICGENRLDYPPTHIEADNRLAWFLGRLEAKYGDEACYIHLKRDVRSTANSYAHRTEPKLLMDGYRNGIYLRLEREPSSLDLAFDLCNTINSNIEIFLANKSNTMTIDLENVQSEFPLFWEKIGAQGELDEALAAWKTSYNPSRRVVRRSAVRKMASKIRRFFLYLPDYFRAI